MVLNKDLLDFLKRQHKLQKIELINIDTVSQNTKINKEFEKISENKIKHILIWKESLINKNDIFRHQAKAFSIIDFALLCLVEIHFQSMNVIYYHFFQNKKENQTFNNKFFESKGVSSFEEKENQKSLKLAGNLYFHSFFWGFICKHLVYSIVINSFTFDDFNLLDNRGIFIFIQAFLPLFWFLFKMISTCYRHFRSQRKTEILFLLSYERSKWSSFSFIFCSGLFLLSSTLLLGWGIYDEFTGVILSNQDLKSCLIKLLAKLMWSFYFIGNMSLFLCTYQFFWLKTQINQVKNWLLKLKMKLKIFYDIQIIICFTLHVIKFSFWEGHMEFSTLMFFLAYFIHFLSVLVYFGLWYHANSSLFINPNISKFYRRFSIFYNTFMILCIILLTILSENQKNNEKILELFKMVLIVKYSEKVIYLIQIVLTTFMILGTNLQSETRQINEKMYKFYPFLHLEPNFFASNEINIEEFEEHEESCKDMEANDWNKDDSENKLLGLQLIPYDNSQIFEKISIQASEASKFCKICHHEFCGKTFVTTWFRVRRICGQTPVTRWKARCCCKCRG